VNCGGPLLDMSGQVIGIHSRIGGSLTANMHVPVSIYRENWERLTAGEMWGEVPRGAPYIGVRGDPASESAKIVFVEPGQPADRAGLQVGDIVTRFDDKEVTDFAALAAMVADKEPGEKVKLDVRRGEASLQLEMEIGRRR
jgi:serine protease Do